MEELPWLDNLNADTILKYLPWSKELPKDIRNFEEEYEELKACE